MSLKLRYQRRLRFEHLALAAAAVALSLILSVAGRTFFDRTLYDFLLPHIADDPQSGIVIVAIDDESLRELGPWPWDRARLAELVDSLTDYGVRGIFLDLLLTEPDLLRPEEDRALATALARNGQVYLPLHVQELAPGGQVTERLPHQRFAREARALGHVDLEPDEDGIVRSVWLRAGVGQAWWPHVALAIFEDEAPTRAARLREPSDVPVGRALMHVRARERLIPFGDPESRPRLSAVDVLGRSVPPQLLDGRLALVGATAPGLGDRMRIPGVDGTVPGVVVNAAILQGLQGQGLIRPLGSGVALAVALLAGLLAAFALPRLSPARGAAAIVSEALLVLAAAWLVLDLWRLWVPVGAALVVPALLWPLWLWRRLALARDYQAALLERLTAPTTFKRRLGPAPSLTSFVRMLDRVLPVAAWRLEHRNHREVQLGGESVSERAWQSSRASHYSFQRGDDRFDLAVLWRAEQLDAGLDRWVQAMARRVGAAPARPRPDHALVAVPMERAAEEEAVQKSLGRFFEAILERLEDGLVICDACGGVLHANARALAWLDVTAEQLDSLHLFDLTRGLRGCTAFEDWPGLVTEALRRGTASATCRRPDGRLLAMELEVVDVGGQPGQVLMLALRDMTALHGACRVRDELLDYMSHDLRSPMISVLALVEKMRSRPEAAELGDFLQEIERHTHRNLATAEQLLNLARVESMEQPAMIDLDMLPVVESAIERVQAEAQRNDIRIRFLYDPADEVWVLGNNELLERLVVNLLSNAIRHSYPGNSVDVTLNVADGRVRCEVRDRGVGVAPEFLERIFERGDDARRVKVRGSGFGLRFVKVVTERHGGSIEASSRPGEGSRFVLALPARQPHEMAE